MQVNLEWATPRAERRIAKMARGSNPPNQNNPEFQRLFDYCLGREDKHWSILQMVNMCVEITTSLDVAAQFKRHWSLACHGPEDLQETSFRYMAPTDYDWGYEPVELRAQAAKNRQSSTETIGGEKGALLQRVVDETIAEADYAYRRLIGAGVAKECARRVLPVCATTRFYVNGTARSWTTYFIQRLSPHAQLEHQELALEIYKHFERKFPTVCNILFRRDGERVVLVDKAADRIAELEAQVAELLARLNTLKEAA